jgi:hypothetical protein
VLHDPVELDGYIHLEKMLGFLLDRSMIYKKREEILEVGLERQQWNGRFPQTCIVFHSWVVLI